jgi:hypothetical protein
MAEPRFPRPLGLYGVFSSLLEAVQDDNWATTERLGNEIHTAAQKQSADSGKGLWQNFQGHADQLRIAIRGKDKGGCRESIQYLRADLTRIIGPD